MRLDHLEISTIKIWVKKVMLNIRDNPRFRISIPLNGDILKVQLILKVCRDLFPNFARIIW